jgi:uncharacterized coiled-coil protein SlyX
MSEDNNNELDVKSDIDAETFQEFAQLLDDDGNLKTAPPDTEEPETTEDDPATLQQTEDGDKPEVVVSAPAEPNVFDGLSPAQQQAVADLQANYAKIQHSENSNRHRVSALTKKLNALEKDASEKETSAPAPSPEGVEDVTTEPEVDLAQFQEDFPEVFGAIKAMNKREVDSVRQQLADVQPTIDTINQDRETDFLSSQYAALAGRHPDFQQIQESSDFWGWIEQQSDGVKQLVGSKGAEDNIVLLDLYKRANSQQYAQPQAEVAPAAEAPSRPRSADAGDSLPRAGVGRLNGGAGSESSSWEYWANQANQDLI